MPEFDHEFQRASQAGAAQSSSDSGACGVPNAAEQYDAGTAILVVPWCITIMREWMPMVFHCAAIIFFW